MSITYFGALYSSTTVRQASDSSFPLFPTCRLRHLGVQCSSRSYQRFYGLNSTAIFVATPSSVLQYHSQLHHRAAYLAPNEPGALRLSAEALLSLDEALQGVGLVVVRQFLLHEVRRIQVSWQPLGTISYNTRTPVSRAYAWSDDGVGEPLHRPLSRSWHHDHRFSFVYREGTSYG